MNKKSIILCLAMMLLPFFASAEDFMVDGIYYYITSKSDKKVAVTYKGSSYDSYSDEYTGAVTIPENVTFNNTMYRVTSIRGSAFEKCYDLTSITIPESVTEIGAYAFCQCYELTSITLPESVTWIGERAFYNCYSLTSITIPEGVKSIENYTFRSCTRLASINIPESVTSIGYEAFHGCSSLTAITCKAVIPPTIGSTNTFYEVDKFISVYVPAGSVAAYQMAEGWSDFKSFEAIKTSVSNITLNQSSITLTEGASITLTAIVTPEDADDTSVTWSSSNEDVVMVSSKGKVVAMGLGTAIITATANDGSGVSASCEVTVKEEGDGIITIYSKSVLINARDGVLTLSGLAKGTEVTLYTTDGAKVAQQQSSAGEATFTVDTNQVYLVHIGDKVVKIGM